MGVHGNFDSVIDYLKNVSEGWKNVSERFAYAHRLRRGQQKFSHLMTPVTAWTKCAAVKCSVIDLSNIVIDRYSAACALLPMC